MVSPSATTDDQTWKLRWAIFAHRETTFQVLTIFGTLPTSQGTPTDSLHLVWAARWEHDKGPDLLLAALRELKRRDVDFRLSVLGQSFRNVPTAFREIKTEFAEQLLHFGFQDRNEYQLIMQQADIFVSTARHEFFGIAAAEAIAAGLFPLLPNGLAYPELVDVRLEDDRTMSGKVFLYGDSAASDETNTMALVDKIAAWRNLSTESTGALEELRVRLNARLDWSTRGSEMDKRMAELVASLTSPSRTGQQGVPGLTSAS